MPTAGSAEDVPQIVAAEYVEPTSRYSHGVLGESAEWGALKLRLSDRRELRIRLPERRVFEDLAPRLADLDRDGAPEVVVVESDASLGARLAVYGINGEIAATPFIGQRFRWLAPIGIADLDQDGTIELAYIDRPHLAKTLRVWSFRKGDLVELASRPGLTNHKIGWDYILGGIRDCGRGIELITADANWSSIVSTRLLGTTLESTIVGQYDTPRSFAPVLACSEFQ